MSHATGAVQFIDGAVLFYEYNGTSDVVCTSLKRTLGEVGRDWRSPANDAKCTCGNDSEEVELMTFYAQGFHWGGRACRTCMAITKGIDPDDMGYDNGTPQWALDAIAADTSPDPSPL